jgi:hypothetical protein
MNGERCERCFGEIMNGKCACGKYTTVVTTPHLTPEEYEAAFPPLDFDVVMDPDLTSEEAIDELVKQAQKLDLGY